jgi:hypothetical protein
MHAYLHRKRIHDVGVVEGEQWDMVVPLPAASRVEYVDPRTYMIHT